MKLKNDGEFEVDTIKHIHTIELGEHITWIIIILILVIGFCCFMSLLIK